MDCPGYGRRLRWVNAVAARGRFKGMQYPTDTSATKVPAAELSGPWTKAAAAIAILASGAPNAEETEHLVSYYSKNIAGNMVWIDSPLNPYKRLVVPRAKSSPVLLLAILAISAQHMAPAKPSFLAFVPAARELVISKITHELSRIQENMGSAEHRDNLDLETLEWVLASMLILSNYECIGSSSTVWCDHRLGARLLINRFSRPSDESSELFRFLRAQFGIHDVLASTTTCMYLGTNDVVLPKHGDPEALLSEYMRLIHEVTICITIKGRARQPIRSLAALRMEFEQIRGLTMMNAATSAALGDGNRRVLFIHLVNVHHLAALLYAYRCVYNLDIQRDDVSHTMQQLFEELEYCASDDKLIHHLTWPVFIAGTNCHGCNAKQELVLRWYGDIIKKTGFRNYDNVTSFLMELWKDNPENWLEKAKAWERDGKPLLAV